MPELGELLAELAGRGLVRFERGGGPHDVHAITVAGMELLAALDEPVAAADRELLAGLGSADAGELVALLGRIRPVG